MQNSYSSRDTEYAGFWVRLAAYVIDSIIVFFGLLFVRLFLSGIMSVLSDTWIGGNILFHYTLKDILLYGFQVLYFILCTYLTGTTLGKRAMNLRVVSADGQKLTILNVVYRETIGRFLCSLSVGIGYIIAGVDREKRGLHDILCDTRVIYAKSLDSQCLDRGRQLCRQCLDIRRRIHSRLGRNSLIRREKKTEGILKDETTGFLL